MQPTKWARRVAGPIAVAALAFAGLAVAAPAQADTAPVDPTTEPTTVTADSLPTVQINGVVWNQQIVGNTVYVAGDFTKARPAGAAAGTNEVNRTYLLAYNLTTGVLVPDFAPVLNGQVKDLALSPDGTRLYAVGNFTTVDSQNRYRIASWDTGTKALTTFKPTVNAPISSVAVTSNAVYFGGTFTSVQGSARSKVASLNPDGTIRPFTASVAGSVTSMTAAPDGASIVIGGSFTSVNGADPYGIARLAAADGSVIPLPANAFVRNGGTDSAILSLESDATSFYGSGYHFGGGGNIEGSFSISWATGQMNWVEDCHGDTYSAFPAGNEVYSASHKHYCGNSGGFPQTNPWTYYRATATSKNAVGVNTPDIYGYPDHAGQPKPLFLNWFPTINTGTFTGKSQGPWTVNGNADYVLYGGEFTQVNGSGQQGLARFARSAIAPDLQGPRLSGAQWDLSANSFASGQVRLSWTTNYDRDNATLTYNLYRTNITTPPIYTSTVTTPFWQPKNMGFVDKNLTPGSSQRYRVEAVDPFGNLVRSDYVTVTVSSDGAASPYTDAVWNDNATSFWRLGEPSGSNVYDWSGFSDSTANAGVTRGVTGAILGDSNKASHFDGSDSGFAATRSPIEGPQVFSIETWFKTTSTVGGKIVSFGNNNTGNSGSYDRHIYITPAGKVAFGVYPGTTKILTSPNTYNDGAWHQVVASLGPDGQKLYVDGKRLATDASVTSAQNYSGYWRIGGDSAWEGNNYFNGDIDDVSIYSSPLTAAQVDAHWVASGRTSTLPVAPADAYGAAVFNLAPDLYWRLNDANGSSTAADAGPLENPGNYLGAVNYQGAGAISGTNKSVELPSTGGTHGLVVASKSAVGPTTYSEELWFKTGTSNGGKLIGFGNATSGTSSNYDRHVYMENDGRLTFGVWTGFTNTITTPLAYNDNQWHHMVATQSSAGMRLYVDGVLRGTNGQTSAQDYSGYWRIGGDNTWGPQPWFDGSLDEVAVYAVALTQEQIASHYDLGQGVQPNVLPTSSFTATPTDLSVVFDGSASTDSDGTISSYEWTFGDGGTATGPTPPAHLYAAAGTYTATLKVTDNRGGTATSTQSVAVVAPNQPPVSSFTATPTELSVVFNGSASSDPDGSLVSYEWNFGDGGTATGATPAAHVYAASGTYTATLKVTDNRGGSTTSSQPVTVLAANVVPVSSFTATPTDLSVVFDGSGSSDPDGSIVSYAWTFGDGGTATGVTPAAHVYGAAGTYTATLKVTDNRGGSTTSSQSVSVLAANQLPVSSFTATSTNLSVVFDGSPSSDPDGTVATYEWTFGDGGTATGKNPTPHVYPAAGTYTATLKVTDNRGGTATSSQSVTVAVTQPENQVPVASFTTTPTNLSVVFDGSGSSDPDGSIVAYEWTFGDGGTDTGATPPAHVYAAGGTYTATLKVTDNGGASATSSLPVTVAAANQAPVSSFTATPTNLSVVFNGSGSSDPDGSIVAYEWTFGDGGTATGATPAAHVYAAAGTYTATLKVTDNRGGTATSSSSVTVSTPAPAVFLRDLFSRTLSNGWGTSDVGGAWTQVGTASRFSVNGTTGVHSVTAGATAMGSYLPSKTSARTDTSVTFSPNKVPNGGGAWIAVQGRTVGTEHYDARARLQADGTVQFHIVRTSTAIVGTSAVPGLTYAAGDKLTIRIQVFGTSPTTVRAKIWKVGTTEPTAWTVSTTDSTAALQSAGSIGITSYLFGTATNGPLLVSYDDLVSTEIP